MKFRRKAEAEPATGDPTAETGTGGAVDPTGAPAGPFDVSQVEGDGIDRADLGSVLVPAIADREPGDRIDIEVQRGGRSVELTVELGTRPARTP